MLSTVKDIRDEFANRYVDGLAIGETIEILGASFLADEETIFGSVNKGYVEREINWYLSESLCVDDIAGKVPEIWDRVSDSNRLINSNYGYLFFNQQNGGQFEKVIRHLRDDRFTRRATAVYTRPSIHDEWNRNGMQDFICTNAVQYLIRDDNVHAVVQMRSNDVVFGYRNDFAWQRFALGMVVGALNDLGIDVGVGEIVWQVSSLHVYRRHWNLIARYAENGDFRGEL